MDVKCVYSDVRMPETIGKHITNHTQPTERTIPAERFSLASRAKEQAWNRPISPATGKDDQPTLYKPEFEHDACGIGALASIKGERSHQILDDALSVLVNLEHRGGVGLERNTGDGAGILFQIPHRFFRKEAQKCGQILPAEGDYGVAMVFLPRDEHGVVDARRIFEEECAACGIPLLFWRTVPVDPHDLGATAQACMPTIMQAFLGRPDSIEGSEHEIPAQLVLIACGDARTGSSLVVSAIADALACAREVAEVLQF